MKSRDPYFSANILCDPIHLFKAQSWAAAYRLATTTVRTRTDLTAVTEMAANGRKPLRGLRGLPLYTLCAIFQKFNKVNLIASFSMRFKLTFYFLYLYPCGKPIRSYCCYHDQIGTCSVRVPLRAITCKLGCFEIVLKSLSCFNHLILLFLCFCLINNKK